jgi:hypothetical protein
MLEVSGYQNMLRRNSVSKDNRTCYDTMVEISGYQNNYRHSTTAIRTSRKRIREKKERNNYRHNTAMRIREKRKNRELARTDIGRALLAAE